MNTGKSAGNLSGTMRSVLALAAGLCLPAFASAEASVYEGWDYATGVYSSISPATGLGWSDGADYFPLFGSIGVANGTLNHPLAPSVSGNAMVADGNTGQVTVNRSLASSTNSSETYWMSFLARRDTADATYGVGVRSSGIFGSSSATFGVRFDGVARQMSYVGRRTEESGPFVTNVDTFVSTPLTAVGSTDFFLIRMNPGDEFANTSTLDFWINPADASNLGAPLGQVVIPNGAMFWSEVYHTGSDVTLDEFRLDQNLANVVRVVPAPAGLSLLGLGGLLAIRRRR